MHRGLKSLLAVAGIALAGCSAPNAPNAPEVTFYSHGTSTAVEPAQYCDANGENCAPPPKDPVGKLPVPPGTPVQISVPADISQAPWQVAYIYRDNQGREQGERTEVFTPDSRRAFTLRLPPNGARLEHVEVQRFSAVLMPGAEGGVEFGIGGSWVLDTR